MKEEFDFYNSTSIKSYNLDDRIRYQLKMLDSLDAFTRRHSENVANITCRLCEKLHMSKGFTIYCTTCAYIHDIGKIFIPPSVLQKPAKLTDEEYEIMKTHTTIGYKMCMEDKKLQPYAAGTLFHHEGLDGSGYPNGVKGNKIPYEAQIIRVADEFEAISAKRQYKTHIGIIETLNILIDHSKPTKLSTVGKVDKKIVKALIKVIIDDTEYENDKMIAASTKSKLDYYKEGVKMYLKAHELPEKCPEMLAEFKEAYKVRKENIYKLYDEVKQMKRLHV